MILLAMFVDRRKTITVSQENFEKYCKLKGKLLLKFGKPEMTFTEFANASMELHDLKLDELLDLRRRHVKGEGHD